MNEGQQLLALVDSSSFWIAAYFKETQLSHIREGARARITLMGHDFEPFEGQVVSVAWGISGGWLERPSSAHVLAR